VLERYIGYIAARVDGLGGNSNTIQPSPTGVPPQQLLPPGGAASKHTGEVCEILFDCFGDFEDFVLTSCDGDITGLMPSSGLCRVLRVNGNGAGTESWVCSA
jgi:hypothetical protein